jgi:hypothetical protein
VGAPAADPDHRDADTPQKRLIPGGPVTSSRGDYRVSTPHDGYGSMASQTGGRGSGSRQAGARWRFGGAATLQGGRGFTGAGASGGSFVTVASVSGKVQTLSRAGGHASWAPLKAGDNLETNSVIRVETGGGNGELGFDQASAGRQSWTRIGGGPDHSVFRLELQH